MSLPHDSAHTHVGGESEYVDDRRFSHGEVLVGVVYSPHARARIKKLDLTAALKVPGVVGAFMAKDFHHNLWGTIFQDQPLLASDEVHFVGEGVALIAARDRRSLVNGLKAVRVDYEALPAILNLFEARRQKSFIGTERKIERGSVETALKEAPHRLEGEIRIRGADHFYLESQASIAYPKEDGQIEIHSSSQHPTEVQHVVAHALGLDYKDVVCIVKRMGGAFGGKESQAAPIAAYAGLVAQKLKVPARLVLTKDDDMIMTGKRNPFLNEYRVGFDQSGRLLALDVALYSDGGAFADLSTAIMERAMLHCDNAYFIPHVRIRGQVCRTHFHPHTAFRGFGGPKGVATIERILEEIAHFLNRDALDLRKLNCYGQTPESNVTPYGQIVENNHLPQLFAQLEASCDYRRRRQQILDHNRRALADKNKTCIRGLSMTAVKFGISFTTRFLNQGNALVHVHRDGSVQVSTGATEMGQGVNARIAELVANEFGLARSRVRLLPTSTERNANTAPTAASSGTDINGSAAVLATRKIKARLSELALKVLELPEHRRARRSAGLGTEKEIELTPEAPLTYDPNSGAHTQTGVAEFHGVEFKDGFAISRADPRLKISFAELVDEAFLNRISLSDYGYFRYPHLSFNKITGQGRAFLYFTQGVAASEVSVNLVTGEVKSLRSDLLLDLGRPINEGLDLGQVWGGFIQGMGWVTTENLFYSDQGLLLSHSPSTYKIPNIQDIPRSFNVQLVPNDGNTVNVRGTKAVGEPPLLLAISVWTAVQDALKALPEYRKRFPAIGLPATQETVLRALAPQEFSRWENSPPIQSPL